MIILFYNLFLDFWLLLYLYNHFLYIISSYLFDWFMLVYLWYYYIYTLFVEAMLYPFSFAVAIMMVSRSCLLISGTVNPASLSKIILALLYPTTSEASSSIRCRWFLSSMVINLRKYPHIDYSHGNKLNVLCYQIKHC